MSFMNAEFVDTNILVYAHDGGAGHKHSRSVELLTRLFEDQTGALSVQVLAEFYSVAMKKLGMRPEQAEEAIADLGGWTIHRPSHADVIRASRLYRRYKLGWWDAMVVNSAVELGCGTIWSEDLSDRQRYSTTVVRNPFR
jgi:predicted nucleic acid-binding protein